MRPRLPDLAFLLAGLVPACSEPAGAPSARPSVILVSIDTLRADHLGLYGYERETSPFLDRLAERGVVFERAFSPVAWTLPAHMTMLTGLYPEQHGVLAGDLALAPEVPLLAERFARAGYRTVGLYQPTWVHPRHGFDRGFEVFRAHANAEQAGAHLFEELARIPVEQPLFLFVHLFDVHSDPADSCTLYSTPEPYRELFVPGAAERLAGVTYVGLKDGKKIEPARRADMIALYDEGIRHVDAALGEWFARLEDEGRLANALVAVTADHGESLGQRGPLGGHGGLHQEGIHVPLILRLPGDARAGTRVRESAHLIDLAPTLLEFAGLPRPAGLPGLSLLAALPAARSLGGSHDSYGYVIRWPEKWMRRRNRIRHVNLERDPTEEHGQLLEMEAYLTQRATLPLAPETLHAGVPIVEMSAEDAEGLRALGYGGELDEGK